MVDSWWAKPCTKVRNKRMTILDRKESWLLKGECLERYCITPPSLIMSNLVMAVGRFPTAASSWLSSLYGTRVIENSLSVSQSGWRRMNIYPIVVSAVKRLEVHYQVIQRQTVSMKALCLWFVTVITHSLYWLENIINGNIQACVFSLLTP